MKLLSRVASPALVEQRHTLADYLSWLHEAQFTFNGLVYQPSSTYGGQSKDSYPASNFPGYVTGAFQNNGPVYACIQTRMLVFAEGRFQWRRLENGRPGDLFGTQELEVLERPWPGGTTGDLLARMEADVSLAGNCFLHREVAALRNEDKITRLRPDWVTIALRGDGADERTAEFIGVIYDPGGPGSAEDPVMIPRNEIAHYAPIPDPLTRFKGMSWITPILREISSDSSATSYKDQFFNHAATPNMVVKFDASVQEEKARAFAEMFRQNHEGFDNAYKTLFLGAGADLTVVGNSFEEIRFAETQGKGETRIAAAAGVPPVLVGLSEGLQSATYSNYGQARRRFADGTLRPLWRNAAGSLEHILDVPPGAQLWYDARDVAFLREDETDIAEIQVKQSTAMKQLVDAGYDADSVVEAVLADDLRKLKHSGLFSVQLQPPGTTTNQSVTTTN